MRSRPPPTCIAQRTDPKPTARCGPCREVKSSAAAMRGKRAASSRLHRRGTMFLMVAVYRAPMRSRNDAIQPQATIDRARRLGVCGFGRLVRQAGERERLARRVTRFAELDEGSFVWTRDPHGWFWLGRISGPYVHDADETAAAVDLVHIRPCEWLSMPILEH